MRRHISAVVILVAGFLTACSVADPDQTAQAGPCTLPEEDLSKIQAMEADHEQQAATADFDAMAEYVADDIVVLAPHQPLLVGKGPLREWQRQFEGVPFDSYDLTVDEIVGCGDLAYVKGSYSMAFTPEGTAQAISDSGSWIHILRRGADGTWIIHRDVLLSEQPLPAG